MTTVLLIGTLDTKGDECRYVRDSIRAHGCAVLVVDVGVLGEAAITPDVSRHEVARAGRSDIASLVREGERGTALATMARGAAVIVRELYAAGRFDGLIALGGSGGAATAAEAMQSLPIGVPKLLVSTVVAGNVAPYVGATDVTLMYSVIDVAGLNRISERIFSNAAAAIVAMARVARPRGPDGSKRLLVGATMFGVTTPCVTRTRKLLEERGYEVAVFSANGVGGRTMERLMEEGTIGAAVDVTTTELADEVVGGILSAGPGRLEMGARLGLPQVVSVGAVDMVNFGPVETMPKCFQGRTIYRHSEWVTLMRTTPEECVEVAQLIARRLNGGRGRCSVLVPLRGTSAIAGEGAPFHDPVADRALVETLHASLDKNVELVELDNHINDPAFASALADKLHENHVLGPPGLQLDGTNRA